MGSVAGSKGGINPELKEKLKDMRRTSDGVEGTVVEDVMGGEPRHVGVVRGRTVYQPMIGGPDVAIGYVENGVAYEYRFGGPDVPIGTFKSF